VLVCSAQVVAGPHLEPVAELPQRGPGGGVRS
jgi:hypothetical protein